MTITRSSLRQAMSRHFNMADIRVILFDLNIDHETLEQDEKTTFILETIRYFERADRIDDLLDKMQELRPDVDFDNLNTPSNLRRELGVEDRQMDRYLEAQFKAYSQIWVALQALSTAGDEVFAKLTSANFKTYSMELLKVRTLVSNNAIFFDRADFEEMESLLQALTDFRVGKEQLQQYYYRPEVPASEAEGELNRVADRMLTYGIDAVRNQIRRNAASKQKYEALLERIRESFQQRLSMLH